MNRKTFATVFLMFVGLVVGTALGQVPHSGQAAANSPHLDVPKGGNLTMSGSPMTPSGTGFNYQGRLTDGGSPANGQYDFRFTLFDALTGGSQVGSPVTLSSQAVSSGLFTVNLDFGSASFDGSARYIQTEVKVAGGPSYTLLSPRQAISAVPYAVNAFSALTVASAPPMRKYYVTGTLATGSQALTACAAGFHMASIYEILNTSTLQYDTSLGATMDDSGQGPVQEGGWVRTGNYGQSAAPTPAAGSDNCNAWTTSNSTAMGTYAYLKGQWDERIIIPYNPQYYNSYYTYPLLPWVAETQPCNAPMPVWCVQDFTP